MRYWKRAVAGVAVLTMTVTAVAFGQTFNGDSGADCLQGAATDDIVNGFAGEDYARVQRR